MINEIIIKLAEFLAKHIKATTMIKYTLLVLSLSLPVGAVLGQWVINLAVVGALSQLLVMEFLYANAAENESSEQSLSENESDQHSADSAS